MTLEPESPQPFKWLERPIMLNGSTVGWVKVQTLSRPRDDASHSRRRRLRVTRRKLSHQSGEYNVDQAKTVVFADTVCSVDSGTSIYTHTHNTAPWSLQSLHFYTVSHLYTFLSHTIPPENYLWPPLPHIGCPLYHPSTRKLHMEDVRTKERTESY